MLMSMNYTVKKVYEIIWMAGDLYDAIFTGNVSKEGQRIVKGGEERAGGKEGGGRHTRVGHFVYGQYCQHFSSQRENTVFKPHFKM